MHRFLRSSIAGLLAALAFAGPGAAAAKPASDSTAKAVPHYDIQKFLATTTYNGGSFSPDGSKILVSSDSSSI